MGLLPLRDTDPWSRDPYPMIIDKDFSTYKEVLEYVIKADMNEPVENSGLASDYYIQKDHEGREALTKTEAEGGYLPSEYTKFNCRDTSLGGSDVINPLPQVCEFDDLVHNLTATRRRNPDSIFQPPGLGRVYSEVIDINQQILWVSCGVPEFTDLVAYYKNAFDSQVSQFANTGKTSLGHLFGKVIGLSITVPLMPFTLVNDTLKYFENHRVTKYYQFRPTMLAYYKTVNTLMVQLAVAMELYPQHDKEQAKEIENDPRMAELVLSKNFKNGISIFRILNKKMYRLNEEDDKGADIDELMDRYENSDEMDERGIISEAFSGFEGAAKSVHQFIGIRIEKTAENNESLSNQTATSSVASTLNQKAKSFSDKKFGMANGNLGVPILDTMLNGVKDVLTGIEDAFAMDGIAAAIKGTGYFDIPDKWVDSSFTKSYSFNVKCYPCSGSKYAIFQSLYFPYLCLMGMGFPRAAGMNSYTSPHVITMYSKGMISCPLGIIDSMVVKRGRPEHGWTPERLPLALEITFTVKDLSPAMFLSVAGDGFFSDGSTPISILMGANENTTMYLNTLAGLGLADIHYTMRQLKRRWEAAFKLMRSQTFNSAALGMALGETPIARSIGSFYNSRLSER